MRTSKVIPEDTQAHFWEVVEDCLREFHPKALVSAIPKMTDLQWQLSQEQIEKFDYFFHSEPFDIACQLAGCPLNVEDHLDRYLKIRDEDHTLL